MVEIGSEFDDKFRCLGSIISTQTIVTTRSCLGNSIPTKVRPLLEVNSTKQVENVTFHDLYNASDSSFDIALLKLKTPIIWSPQLYPACLWMNKTHTPMITRMLFMGKITILNSTRSKNDKTKSTDDDQVSVQMIQAKYNSDCQRVHPRELHRSQLCAKEVWDEPVCRKSGDVLVSQTAVGPSFLVGLALHEDGCSGWDYGTFTRISMLVDWISGNM
uniref:Serine protease snake n=2 Tax=Culex pipiens TaxID=7175 RepID=A0A8D8PFL3_CULPI